MMPEKAAITAPAAITVPVAPAIKPGEAATGKKLYQMPRRDPKKPDNRFAPSQLETPAASFVPIYGTARAMFAGALSTSHPRAFRWRAKEPAREKCFSTNAFTRKRRLSKYSRA